MNHPKYIFQSGSSLPLKPSSYVRIPKDWKDVGRVHPKEELHLTFALKQQNTDLLERRLGLVSDPDSAHYGKTFSIVTCSTAAHIVRSTKILTLYVIRFLHTKSSCNVMYEMFSSNLTGGDGYSVGFVTLHHR